MCSGRAVENIEFVKRFVHFGRYVMRQKATYGRAKQKQHE